MWAAQGIVIFNVACLDNKDKLEQSEVKNECQHRLLSVAWEGEGLSLKSL